MFPRTEAKLNKIEIKAEVIPVLPEVIIADLIAAGVQVGWNDFT